MFDDHAFDDVGDIFAAIDGVFEFLVHVFPLNHFQWIAILVEESANRTLINIIAFILQPVQLNQALRDTLGFLQDRHNLIQLHRHALNDSG